MNSSFSFNRISNLSKKEFYLSYLPFFKIMSIVLGGVLLVTAIIAYFENTGVKSISLEAFFVIFGFIYVVNSFEELKKLPTRADFLNLPATAAEKVFTKWLFSNVLFWLGSLLLFALYFLCHELIIGMIMNKSEASFNVFTADHLKGLHYLTIIFSVFFFGAAMFNTGGWYKVVLWTVIGALAYILVVFCFAYILFPEFRSTSDSVTISNRNIPIDLMLEDFWMFKFGKFFLDYLAAPFFWYMSYLKIKEKQV